MPNRRKSRDEIDFNTIVGKNIKYLRKQRKITQTELGWDLGISFQQIQKYEKGTNGLHSRNLHRMANKAFNISMDVLVDPQMIMKHEGYKERLEEAVEWR